MADDVSRIIQPLDQVREALARGQYNEEVQLACDARSLQLSMQKNAAAIVVAVRGIQQQSWSRHEEMSVELYEKLALQVQADVGEVTGNFRELDAGSPVARAVCSNCRIRPGFGPCPLCSGVGVLIVQGGNSDQTDVVDCHDCEDGFSTCTVCGGTRQSVLATLRYINRKPFFCNHVIAPDMPDTVGSAVRAAFCETSELPKALAFDLFNDSASSAYRGAHREMNVSYHGYPLGRAVAEARAFHARVRAAPNLLVRELDTVVVPLVLAAFDAGTQTIRVAFFVDPELSVRWRLV